MRLKLLPFLSLFLCVLLPASALAIGALTPIGAESGGNADGSIPAWTGGLQTIPATYDENRPDVLPDPFAGDKPLYQVNKDNLANYQHLLSDGQIAQFKQRTKAFYMNVYPSRRSAAYPESVYEATAANVGKIRLNAQGSGLESYHSGVPFREPKTALEVIWNHVTRYRGTSIRRKAASTLVQENGSYALVKSVGQVSFSHSLKDAEENILFYLKSSIVAPPRLAGEVLLVHETFDQLKEARKAWLYSSSQRRVRRVPDFAYDSAIPFSDGFVVADQVDMFNGAPDRYDWQLLGKKELLIPYNSYALFSKERSYSDLLLPGHIDSQYLRYEKHRVWVVEAKLKANARHIYGKRVFYVDEDSWQISVVDYFDARQEIWRIGEAYGLYFYQQKIPAYAFEAIYDLKSKRYVVSGISNEEVNSLEFDIKAGTADYTPAAIRRESRR